MKDNITKNDITGNRLVTKPTTEIYRSNWEKIFGKDKLNSKSVDSMDIILDDSVVPEEKYIEV